jgi:hypothetical protein
MRPARSSRVGGARPPRRVSGPTHPGERPAPARSAASARPSASRATSRPAAAASFARPAAALGGRLAAAAGIALPQHAPRPSAPARRPVAVPRPRRSDLPLGARALGWLRALPDHRLLDRLIGGRAWIVLIGTLLVGIVTMQLALLRLNAGIGRAVERSSALEQRNAALRLETSQLSNSQRIVALATQMGYVWPPQGSPRFLTASAGDGGRALTTMRVPDPTAATTATATTTGTTGVAAGTTTATTAPAGGAPGATGATAPATTSVTPTTPGASSSTGSAAAGTTAPATGATAPSTTAASAPTAPTAAGGASAPVGGQG